MSICVHLWFHPVPALLSAILRVLCALCGEAVVRVPLVSGLQSLVLAPARARRATVRRSLAVPSPKRRQATALHRLPHGRGRQRARSAGAACRAGPEPVEGSLSNGVSAVSTALLRSTFRARSSPRAPRLPGSPMPLPTRSTRQETHRARRDTATRLARKISASESAPQGGGGGMVCARDFFPRFPPGVPAPGPGLRQPGLQGPGDWLQPWPRSTRFASAIQRWARAMSSSMSACMRRSALPTTS